jgi:Putative zinc-finger
MLEETKHGSACSEFEALLMDALEGQLTGARKESFEAHRRACEVCGPLFADVEAGRLWLRSLEPVEPPPHLMHNILVATTGVVSTRLAPRAAGARTTPFGERVREWWDAWFAPTATFVRQPRFVMSFGMIFFTGSLLLSTAGVKAADVAKIDLRPAALRHAYNGAQIKVVQYYDNIRFVYEIESKVRELKRATTPAEPGPQPKKQDRNNDDTSGQPDQRQDRNYSQEQGQVVLAALRDNPPAVTVTTNRRFV